MDCITYCEPMMALHSNVWSLNVVISILRFGNFDCISEPLQNQAFQMRCYIAQR